MSDIEKSGEIPAAYIEIQSDSTNSLDINHIRSEESSKSFMPLTSFKGKKSNRNTYWLRLKIDNYNIADTLVGLFIPLENHVVDVYTITDSSFSAKRTGFFINTKVNDEIIPLSNILLLKGTGRISLYVKIKNINDELPKFQLKLINVEKAILINKEKITIDAIVQGMIWLMLLYGIFLFILHRDKLYLYYSVYSLCLSLWLMGTWGFYYQFAYSLPRSFYPYQSIPGFLGILFYLQFIRTFINTSKVFPRWDKALKFIQFFTLVEITRISIFVPSTNLLMTNYYIQASVSMLMEMSIMVFIINVLLTKIQFKYNIGIGSSILFLFNFGGTLLWLFYSDNSWFILQKTGAVLELLIFNFGLSYRYWVIEKREQKIQKKLILQLNKNAELQEKVNLELEQKVQERTIEIRQKNVILEEQKDEIEYQKNNLTASIHYAERIQSALLTSTEILRQSFRESFILFKPVEMVSGDFYWFKKSDDLVYVAAADCTGHGVPGAFMSILGVTQLNEILGKSSKVDSNEILNQLRDYVIKALHQSDKESGSRDGMEVALCIIDTVRQNLQYSGANRQLYLIHEDEISEFKGDPMPVGISDDNNMSFTSLDIPYKKGDLIYLFSDGFVDQLGGPDRKTFRSENFKKLLLSIHHLSLDEQKECIVSKHEEWKGENDQTDDILVIGIKLN